MVVTQVVHRIEKLAVFEELVALALQLSGFKRQTQFRRGEQEYVRQGPARQSKKCDTEVIEPSISAIVHVDLHLVLIAVNISHLRSLKSQLLDINA